MKKLHYILLIISFWLTLPVYSQRATYTETEMELMTYPFFNPNPVPETGIIYPYFRFDGYSAKGEMQKHKMVVLENDYIKLWVTPDIGGKIWGAVEKSTGKEFIYFNHAVKFRDIAMRGPWTSGGLEFNFGVIGHAPTCSSPVDYLVRNNEDGSVSCFIGAIDLPSGTRWSVEINLPSDKAWFSTRCSWDNSKMTEQSYYHWTNLGLKTDGKLEYAFPGNHYLGHDGKAFSWPKDKTGRELQFYDNNDFGTYKSYHVYGNVTDFYGGFWHNDNFGFGHYSPYDEKPGKKIWIWGLSDQGMIWEKLLTDTDGQYTELQSGRLFNQEAAESTFSPFKHKGFMAGTTDEWTEYWFPVVGTNGLNYANEKGSVNLLRQQNMIQLAFCPNERVDGTLEVRDTKGVQYKKELTLTPLQPFSASFEYDGRLEELAVYLNSGLFYQANPAKSEVKRPVELANDFDWQSAYGHWVMGKELEKQRQYGKAEAEYQKSLAEERWFVPALNGMSLVHYRKTNYAEALKYALDALSVDTYDAEANMHYALASLALGDTISAIDGFSLASGQPMIRSAAYNGLATLSAVKKEYDKSLSYAQKSLLSNGLGSEAQQMRIISLRKLGKADESMQFLSQMEAADPLNHFVRLERWLSQPDANSEAAIGKVITNEFPIDTWLTYVSWYVEKGCTDDALKLLSIAPESPQLLLLEAFLLHRSGDNNRAQTKLEKAVSISAELIFPSQIAMLEPLRWAGSVSSIWKIKWYEGLLLFSAGDEEKGKSLWLACENQPDYSPFYLARSKVYEPGNPKAADDVERAMQLAGSDWRTELFASKFYLEKGDTLKSLELVRRNTKTNPDNYYVGLHHAKLLEMTGSYATCVSLLKKIDVLPNEGATEGRVIWRNANFGHALEMMRKKQYGKALDAVALARQWPENLGVGRPYIVDERLEDYFSYLCYRSLNNKVAMSTALDRIVKFRNEAEQPLGEGDFIYALALKQAGKLQDADRVMEIMTSKLKDKQLTDWMNALYAGREEEARTLAPTWTGDNRTIKLLMNLFNQ